MLSERWEVELNVQRIAIAAMVSILFVTGLSFKTLAQTDATLAAGPSLGVVFGDVFDVGESTLARGEAISGRAAILIHKGDVTAGRVAERYRDYIAEDPR